MSARLAIGLSGGSLVLMLLAFAAYLRACCNRPSRKPPMTKLPDHTVWAHYNRYGEPDDH